MEVCGQRSKSAVKEMSDETDKATAEEVVWVGNMGSERREVARGHWSSLSSIPQVSQGYLNKTVM